MQIFEDSFPDYRNQTHMEQARIHTGFHRFTEIGQIFLK